MRPVCTSENCGAGTGGTLVAAFALERAYNAKIEKCQTAQDDLRFAFDAANEIHAQHYRDESGGMIEAQTRTRELPIEWEGGARRALRVGRIPAAQPRSGALGRTPVISRNRMNA